MASSALIAAALLLGHVPPEQFRHEQLTAVKAAFSRFVGGDDGGVERRDLPEFVRYIVGSMNSQGLTAEQLSARSADLTRRLMVHLPQEAPRLTLSDVLRATEKILVYPKPPEAEQTNERGQLGSKQLRTLRKRLEENRLTMPLFDTRGWVRDFEKALKIQWEIYANGFKPMHIVVARSDRLYGVTTWQSVDAGDE
jgi:hypothetical protein